MHLHYLDGLGPLGGVVSLTAIMPEVSCSTGICQVCYPSVQGLQSQRQAKANAALHAAENISCL